MWRGNSYWPHSPESSHRILISPSFSQLLLIISPSLAPVSSLVNRIWLETSSQFQLVSNISGVELCAQRTINIVVGREWLQFICQSSNLPPRSCGRSQFGVKIWKGPYVPLTHHTENSLLIDHQLSTSLKIKQYQIAKISTPLEELTFYFSCYKHKLWSVFYVLRHTSTK